MRARDATATAAWKEARGVAHESKHLDAAGKRPADEPARPAAALELAEAPAGALERMTDAFFALDASWRFTYVNAAAERLFARSRAELLGRVVWDAFPETVGSAFQQRYEQARATGEMLVFVAFYPPLGRWFAVRAYPGTGDDAGTLSVCFQDATAERAEQDRIRWQAALLDQAHDAMFVWELGGPIVYWNRGAELLYGFAPEEARGRVSHDLLRTALPVPAADFEAALERAGEWTGELAHTTRDGRRVVVLSRVQVVREADGRRYVLETSRDVTERLRLEGELAQSERRFRALFEQAAVGMAQVGLDGRWIEVNDRFCAITGYRREELQARTWQDITHPDDLAADLAALGQLLAGERDRYELEKRYLRRDGTIVWGELTVALVRDEAGDPGYFISVVEDISARKRAEEALQASEERLRLALDAASSGTFVWYPEEDRTESDAQMLRLFGLHTTSELTLASALATMVHAEDRAHYAAAVARALDPQGSGELREDIRVVLPDGAQRWLAITGRVAFDGERPELRKALRMFGTAVDITERKRTEEALRESEEKFRLLADNMPQLAWMADETGERFWYNQRWYDYTGTTWEEMRGRGWRRVHHPEHVRRMEVHFQRSREVAEPWEETFPLRGKDGGYRWFLTRALPVRDASGAVVRWFGTSTDIEDQRRLQDELAAANAALTTAKEAAEERARELAVILNTMDDAVWLVGPGGELVRTNEAFFRLVQIEGLPEWQATYMRATSAERNALLRSVDLAGRPLPEEAWPAARLSRGERFTGAQALEARITGHAGRERAVRVSGVPLRDALGRPSGGVVVLHDITDLVEREQERAQMLDVVAHELNTPVTALKATVQINQRRLERGVALTSASLASEAKAVARMERLVGDLLEAARAETGHLELQRAPTDLTALCEQVASEQMAASGRGIALELPAAPLVGEVDAGRIAQVVGNLLSNALKYSPAEATITLTLREQGLDAVLVVRDTGPGIPQEALPRLFERFYRAPGVQVLHGSGVGLGVGLYLCKQFVEWHGGAIAVESRVYPDPGHGTTFTVRLPLAPATGDH